MSELESQVGTVNKDDEKDDQEAPQDTPQGMPGRSWQATALQDAEAFPDATTETGEPKARDTDVTEPGAVKTGPEKGEKPDDGDGFDKALQPHLQKAANERKLLEAKNAELTAQIESLNSKLTQVLEKGAETQPPAEPGRPEAVAELDKIDEQITKLTGESTGDDVVNTVKSLGRAVALVRESVVALGQTAPKEDPRVKELQTEIATLKRSDQTRTDNDDFNRTLDLMDTKYGAEYRNEAVDEALKFFAERGYSQEKPPPNDAVAAVIETMYERQKLSKGKPKSPRGGPKTGPASDPGGGGRTAPPAPVSYDEAMTRIGRMPWKFGED